VESFTTYSNFCNTTKLRKMDKCKCKCHLTLFLFNFNTAALNYFHSISNLVSSFHKFERFELRHRVGFTTVQSELWCLALGNTRLHGKNSNLQYGTKPVTETRSVKMLEALCIVWSPIVEDQSCVKGCCPPKKSRWGPLISMLKHLGSCMLFRARCKLAPWAALFENLTTLN